MANEIGEVGYVHPSGTVTYVPSAASVKVGQCEDLNCDHIHVFLLDQVGQPFAEATLSEAFAEKLANMRRRR